MDVAEVDRPVQRLVPVQAAKTVHAIHPSKVGSERQVGGHGRPEVALTLDGREGSLGDERLGCSCLLGFWDVGASILAIINTLPCPGGFCRERVDNLNPEGISTVRTTSSKRDKTNLRGNRDTEEVDETNVLVPNDLDLIDQTEPAEIIPQLFFGRVLIQPAEIHVPAGIALLDRQRDLAGNWGGFSPTNLQLLSVEGQFLHDRVGIELSGGRGV